MTYFGEICNEKWIFWNINGSVEANNLNHKLKSTPIETFDNDLVKLHSGGFTLSCYITMTTVKAFKYYLKEEA